MPDSILDYGQEIKPGSKPAMPGLCEFLAIEAWTKRNIPPADRLLGDLVTTTSRMFLVGSTGLGKTLLALGMACGMASGRGFLHWRAERAAKVLYIDGEMPEELIRARSIDALRDRAPWRGVGLATSSRSPAGLAGFIRLPRRAA
jgi:hypothetical protein